MPGTTSTALPSFSHDQHRNTDAAKRKRGAVSDTSSVVVHIIAMQRLPQLYIYHLSSSSGEARHTQSRWIVAVACNAKRRTDSDHADNAAVSTNSCEFAEDAVVGGTNDQRVTQTLVACRTFYVVHVRVHPDLHSCNAK